jgi:UMF1 family MFS transporter
MARDAGLSPYTADAYWGYATSLATLLVALCAPVLGALGDYRNMKMRLFKIFFVIAVISTAALAAAQQWFHILVLYAVTITGFAGANLFYDAFLVDVTTEDRMDMISTYGFALGYIGGSTIPFIISIALIMFGPQIGIPAAAATRFSFFLTALWWTVFSIPMLKNVKQVYFIEPALNMVLGSFGRLLQTFRNIRRYRHVFLFLAAYFFYIDGVNTIINMAAVYGDSVGLSSATLLLALLVTQVVAFPFAIIYGALARVFGAKKMILAGTLVYLLVCVLGYRMKTAFDFWVLALLVATSQGGMQALSRSFFGRMVPKENSNEFFGFYDIIGKFAAVMGPALYGLFSQLMGHSRYGVLSVMVLFLLGGGIFLFVPLQQPSGTDL